MTPSILKFNWHDSLEITQKKLGFCRQEVEEVVHTTAKQVISIQGKNANCYQMYRKLKPRAKRAKIISSLLMPICVLNMQIF